MLVRGSNSISFCFYFLFTTVNIDFDVISMKCNVHTDICIKVIIICLSDLTYTNYTNTGFD